SLHDADSAKGRAAIARWQEFWAPYRRPQDRVHMQRAHNWGHQHQWQGRLSAYREVYHPCIMPWSTIQITAMGKVALCPQDFNALMNLGDINRQSIAEAWRGGDYDALRRLHATGNRNEVGFCRGCVLYDKEVSLEARLATPGVGSSDSSPGAKAVSAGGGEHPQ
ncbi:MAG: SPASM domain-containing protein, partial [Alphaproteobacteria bacterium]|nr:SPASM domain-containing protein [Alphaproteobacteria bacterium]